MSLNILACRASVIGRRVVGFRGSRFFSKKNFPGSSADLEQRWKKDNSKRLQRKSEESMATYGKDKAPSKTKGDSGSKVAVASESHEQVISIDRSGLMGESNATKSSDSTQSTKYEKEEPTELANELRQMIEATGPISVAEYMKQTLLHPSAGFYMSGDVFGTQGDFTTAPEISQVFGELIALWFVLEWQRMGSPKEVQLLEMGPGRGTLMKDILRTVSRFPDFSSAVRPHLVEVSSGLKAIQQKSLMDGDRSKENSESYEQNEMNSIAPVEWYEKFDEVPSGMPLLMVAQELFDALPVHQFQMTERGWCERLIDVDNSSDSPFNFRLVLSPIPTPASTLLLGNLDIGESIEICPAGQTLAFDVTRRLQRDGGAALFTDYGKDGNCKDSVRGIYKHKFCSILQKPGLVDLSADVDFSQLRSASFMKIKISYGPADQGNFLMEMGIHARVEALLKNVRFLHEFINLLFFWYEILYLNKFLIF
eukprot:GSMAST32.ASY1.ANO1.1071.1 assembled CDS